MSKSRESRQGGSTCSVAAHLANPSQWQVSGAELKMIAETLPLSFQDLARNLERNGCFGKMCKDASQMGLGQLSLPQQGDQSLQALDAGLKPDSLNRQTAGTVWHGVYWTQDILESPNAGAECSLSDVLESQDLPHLRQYSLSVRAAKGILNRVKAKSNHMPPELMEALEMVVKS